MTGSEFGDVVLVPFAFTDQRTTKRRPAVVVSSADHHRRRRDVIIVAVTSQARPALRFGEAPIARWEEAGLLRPSVLKPVLATVARELVLRPLGALGAGDRRALRRVLRQILGG